MTLEPMSKETLARLKQENKKKSKPSLVEQAKTFGGAMVRHALNGFKRASDGIIAKRLAICKKCPEYVPRTSPPFRTLKGLADLANCRQCGCYVHGYDIQPNKLALPKEECPLKKWLREQ